MTTNDRRNFAEIAEYRARHAAASLVHYAEQAAPHSAAMAPAEVLYNAADEIGDLIIERDRARLHRALLAVLAATLAGMLGLALWTPDTPAYCEAAPLPVMQLDPTEARAAPGAAEWL